VGQYVNVAVCDDDVGRTGGMTPPEEMIPVEVEVDEDARVVVSVRVLVVVPRVCDGVMVTTMVTMTVVGVAALETTLVDVLVMVVTCVGEGDGVAVAVVDEDDRTPGNIVRNQYCSPLAKTRKLTPHAFAHIARNAAPASLVARTRRVAVGAR
jgi:hypothetical protein